MSAYKKWRLICYDVCDPKRYRKIYKLIRGVGRPVQYSIFRAKLDEREVARLRWELAALMSGEDRLLVLDLCPRCASHVISRNHVEGWIDEEVRYEIVPALAPNQESAGVAAQATEGPSKASKRNNNRGTLPRTDP